MVFWSNFIKKIKNAVSKERVDKLEQKINTNATNIELLEQDIDTNTNSISDIKNNITSINSNINDLDNDVARVENSLTNTNNELDSLEARVNGYDDRINEANNKANEANTKATNAEEQATGLGLTVSTNTTKITALETKNTELINKVNTNTSNINSLKGTVDGIIKLKFQWIDISRFTNDNGYNTSGGRNQTYRYPIPTISLSRIVSITGIAIYADNYYTRSIVSFSTGTFDSTNHILVNFFVAGANSSFNVSGKVYIWYYD